MYTSDMMALDPYIRLGNSSRWYLSINCTYNSLESKRNVTTAFRTRGGDKFQELYNCTF